MARSLREFLDEFTLPLLRGGPVPIGGPIRPAEHTAMVEDAGELGDPDLRFARLARARELVANPNLPDPDLEELALWVGLYNVLALDHPERRRVWARASTWQRVEHATRSALTLSSTQDRDELLARHAALGAFASLTRDDTVVSTVGGELRFYGQTPPARRFGVGALAKTGTRTHTVRWLDQSHAPEVQRLLPVGFESSPLTCLLMPSRAPEGWNPLVCGVHLRERALARAVTYAWARSPSWIETGGRVMAGLLTALDAHSGPGVGGQARAAPDAVTSLAAGAVVGALIHLHFLKVLDFEARVGVALGAPEPGIREFLALPLLLPQLAPVLGSPIGEAGADLSPGSAKAERRFIEYLDHLGELVPRSSTENLVATVVPHIVQTS